MSETPGNQVEAPPVTTAVQRPLRDQKWVIVMAACLAGMMIGYGLSGFVPKVPDWKRAAAQHHALYEGWTVVSLSPTVAELNAQLAFASNASGTKLSVATLSAAKSLTLKRVDVLGIHGNKLVQILYVAAGARPIALYAINRQSQSKWTLPELTIESGTRNGSALATWSTKTTDFMLIGREDQNTINALAERLRSGIPNGGR